MLKRYGFCLAMNKYNYIFIKLRLEQNDPEFKYRQFVIRKFFSIDSKPKKNGDDIGVEISSRHFKVYYQRLNTSNF